MNNRKSSLSNLEPIISPLTAAVIGLVGVFVLYQIGGSILTLIIFGFDLKNADINAMRLMTMAGQILFILLPALILAKYVYTDVTTALRVRMPKKTEMLYFTIGLFILIPLLQNYLYIQNYLFVKLASSSSFFAGIKNTFDSLDKLVESTYGNLLEANNIWEGSLVILVIGITPAFCEEILFRGFIQSSLELKSTPFKGALYTAIFFGFYHFNPYGLIPLIILGLYFGYAVYVTDSIATSITLHFTNNFISILLFFIFGNSELLDSSVPPPNEISGLLIQFVLLAIVFTAFIIFLKKIINHREVENDLP